MARFFHDNTPEARRMLRDIAVAAMRAALVVIETQAKKNTRGGFTSGRFVTGGWRSITHEVVADDHHVEGSVGTTLRHFAFWELGHQNIFTRRYERAPWLRPAMEETQAKQQIAADRAALQVAKAYGRDLDNLGGLPGVSVRPVLGDF